MISQLEVTAALQAKLGLQGKLGLAGGTLRFFFSILITFTFILILFTNVNTDDVQHTNRNVIKTTIRGMRSVGSYERVVSGVIYTNKKPAYYLNRFVTIFLNTISTVCS